jgi:hypothetical protein
MNAVTHALMCVYAGVPVQSCSCARCSSSAARVVAGRMQSTSTVACAPTATTSYTVHLLHLRHRRRRLPHRCSTHVASISRPSSVLASSRCTRTDSRPRPSPPRCRPPRTLYDTGCSTTRRRRTSLTLLAAVVRATQTRRSIRRSHSHLASNHSHPPRGIKRKHDLDISSRTIARRLDEAGLHARLARHVFTFTDEHKRRRLSL